jgi:hypothetical protein
MRLLVAVAAVLLLLCVSTAHAQSSSFGANSGGTPNSGGNYYPGVGMPQRVAPAPQQYQQQQRKKKVSATARWLLRQR